MLKLKQISSKDKAEYNYFEQIITSSFPTEEYRELSELKKYADENPYFICNIIVDRQQQPVGIFTYWDFGRFYYVEHFAIDPGFRSHGYGGMLLKHISEELKKPIVLEVELPEEELAQRRIHFYERYNFSLWNKSYSQPPYRKEHTSIPMRLMALGEMDEEKDYDYIVGKIHRHVYNVS